MIVDKGKTYSEIKTVINRIFLSKIKTASDGDKLASSADVKQQVKSNAGAMGFIDAAPLTLN